VLSGHLDVGLTFQASAGWAPAASVRLTMRDQRSVQAELHSGSLSAARISHPAMYRPVYRCRSASLPQSSAASVVQGLLTEILEAQIACQGR
jgi:hypothetical protein